MISNNKEILKITKKLTKNRNNNNNNLLYSDQSSNDVTYITNNIKHNKNVITFKTNYMPSLTSIITNKLSSGSISDYSYTDKKINRNKNNPFTIFDSHKSLFTSIDDEYKYNIKNINTNTNTNINKKKDINKNNENYKRRNKSNNNLYNKINFKTNKNENNDFNALLKKMASIKFKINSLNKKDDKIKIYKVKNKQNGKNIKLKNIEIIPKLILKKNNYSFVNNKKIYNIKKKNMCGYSQSKENLPNISIEDNINNKIKNNINIKESMKKNYLNLNTMNKTLITFNKNKEEIKNNKNIEFIKKIKNKQLMNLVRRFKLLENKNNEDELKSIKNNIFPINTIKILFLKRKELSIDKFRNEYLNKLENIPI